MSKNKTKILESCYHCNPNVEKVEYIRNKVEEETKARSKGKDDRFLFNLLEKNRVVGGCYGKRYFNSLHIYLVWVESDSRHLGYGRKLMGLVEKLALEKKCDFITLNTIVNESANQFYLKLGYKKELERCGYTDKGRACFFIKKLTKG